MSNHDGSAEVVDILARLDGGLSIAVLEDTPDDQDLPRDKFGYIAPYVTVEPYEPMRIMRGRGLGVGEDKQPYTLPIEITYFADSRSLVRQWAAAGRNRLLGYTPGTGNAGPMKATGGYSGTVLDSESKPSRFYRSQLWECVINMSLAD